MLKFNTKERWSAQEALNHHYFRGLRAPKVALTSSQGSSSSHSISPPPPQFTGSFRSNTSISPVPVTVTMRSPGATKTRSPVSTMSESGNSSQVMVTSNDENNPNAGNSPKAAIISSPSNTTTSAFTRVQEIKLLDRNASSVSTSGTSYSSNIALDNENKMVDLTSISPIETIESESPMPVTTA